MNEIILDEFTFLVCEIDTTGIVTFANDNFCQLSEYTLNELIGQSYNATQHLDMPKSILKFLWETIQKEEIWTGAIQHKTKNRSYYWVYATIYPMELCNGSKGYMTCERKLSNEDRMKYESLYKVLKNQEI